MSFIIKVTHETTLITNIIIITLILLFLLSSFRIKKNLVFITNTNFCIPITVKPDGVNFDTLNSDYLI